MPAFVALLLRVFSLHPTTAKPRIYTFRRSFCYDFVYANPVFSNLYSYGSECFVHREMSII